MQAASFIRWFSLVGDDLKFNLDMRSLQWQPWPEQHAGSMSVLDRRLLGSDHRRHTLARLAGHQMRQRGLVDFRADVSRRSGLDRSRVGAGLLGHFEGGAVTAILINVVVGRDIALDLLLE